jgi:uncharacterized protein
MSRPTTARPSAVGPRRRPAAAVSAANAGAGREGLPAGCTRAATRERAPLLLVFLVVAYAAAWLSFAVPILASEGALTLPVPQALFFALATFGIGLAGVGAVAAESGRTGVHDLLGRIVRWRVRPVWYLAAFAVPALFPLGAFWLGVALGNPIPLDVAPTTWLSAPLLLVAVFPPALFEEIGWRGYALPRLQRRLGPLAASLVLGVIWAGVHLPLWLVRDFGFASQSVPLYVVQIAALSVVLAWLYNATRGSVLVTGIAHAAANAWPMLWGAAIQTLPEDARGIPPSHSSPRRPPRSP